VRVKCAIAEKERKEREEEMMKMDYKTPPAAEIEDVATTKESLLGTKFKHHWDAS
jgi:hypothetical protein